VRNDEDRGVLFFLRNSTNFLTDSCSLGVSELISWRRFSTPMVLPLPSIDLYHSGWSSRPNNGGGPTPMWSRCCSRLPEGPGNTDYVDRPDLFAQGVCSFSSGTMMRKGPSERLAAFHPCCRQVGSVYRSKRCRIQPEQRGRGARVPIPGRRCRQSPPAAASR
jgi:hypothetical protein